MRLSLRRLGCLSTLGLLAILVGYTGAAVDLTLMGMQSERWSVFQKARAKAYLESGVWLAWLAPPVFPTADIHDFSTQVDAYLDHDLPPTRALHFWRKRLLAAPGFRDSLVSLENQALAAAGPHGSTARAVYNTKQRQVPLFVGLLSWVPIHDVWQLQLRVDVVDGKPYAAFFVNGLGIVRDTNAPIFFGAQTKKHLGVDIGPAMLWFNKLEPEGLARGYLVNLTESDATSSFSSQRMSVAQWEARCRDRAARGLGRSARAL